MTQDTYIEVDVKRFSADVRRVRRKLNAVEDSLTKFKINVWRAINVYLEDVVWGNFRNEIANRSNTAWTKKWKEDSLGDQWPVKASGDTKAIKYTSKFGWLTGYFGGLISQHYAVPSEGGPFFRSVKNAYHTVGGQMNWGVDLGHFASGYPARILGHGQFVNPLSTSGDKNALVSLNQNNVTEILHMIRTRHVLANLTTAWTGRGE